MVMQLENVVPFGRSFDEYIKMFNLSAADLKKTILGVADGPASFNAEGTKQWVSITSIDPIYQFTGEEIEQRFNTVIDNIIEQVKATPNDWVWSYHHSPDNLRKNRLKVLQEFLADYDLGKKSQRYCLDILPNLSFNDNNFDLALCSHFLFLYSDHYDLKFHLESIQEMLRVSSEVRIFPLLTLMLEISPHLDPIIHEFQQMEYDVSIIKVEYELQKGGNQMLVIRR
ncbi:SAM-dependent methyltransferase [Crocosphaera sp. UHCC 0190]|uniref:SAM-dependent methyltransferase n=1 Tax=Crocosphaera sp. UHCC 0190 TaxID=3110246 RepID=UPI002B1F9EA6|nr:SAM-dependent methyltransferase [Crocosphaera sp. UHCC 0190]MEA5512053.1 SAM-dependent methyltransferase [Crocosphaera sp. UHCC 0190]